MDNYLIIEFPSQPDAQSALDSVNEQIFLLLQGDGYTVVDNAIVGKNDATGQDDPSATKTSTWAVIQQSPDSTFYFSSPHNDPRFQGVVIKGGIEKPFPTAWQQIGDV